jgi:hypothetical protein
MNIDRRLHLVIPIVDDEGKNSKVIAYVHSSSISSEVFHAYYKPMGRALGSIYQSGLFSMGPRLAHLSLRDAAKELGIWEGEHGVERGLVQEIYRNTVFLRPGKEGWESIPYGQARAQKIITAEDADEIDGAIVFFTLASSLHRRVEAEGIITEASRLWSARIESLNSTEFQNSLATSKKDESFGATAVA